MRAVLAALICLLCVTTSAFASVDSDWMQFRKRFPYHIQVIAIAAPATDGTRTLIISEPPPSITLDSMIAAYGRVLRQIETRRHRVGFDGWIKDVVGELPAMSEAEQETFIADLSRYIFGTSYKAYALDLSAPASSPSSYDLMVGASALSNWLGFNRPPASPAAGRFWTRPQPAPAGAAGPLRPLHGGDPRMLSDLLSEPTTGVYMSEAPGLVVLVVPRREPLNHASSALREFALDSDLVLGAIGTAHSVAVVARERQDSVIALPPLRVETLLQLASASSEELGQSYERLDLFAGRLQAMPRDWAPIFLSPQLHDSEYGSLLNITDQLLKSWSEHGNIKYINFDYPQPPGYPFPNGLFKHAKARAVTYNWNTKGVGYVENRDGYEIVAFSRTGALPVDYLGEHDSRMRDYEDRAYDYFAGKTNDPNLARVVQYAGFYQICRHFSLNATFAPSTRVRGGADALQPFARRILDLILETDVDARVNPARLTADPELAKDLAEYRKIRSAVQSEAAGGEPALQQLAGAMVRLREASRGAGSDPRRRQTVGLAHTIVRAQVVRMLAGDATDVAARRYAEAEGGQDPDGWIKTPSIVLSWSTAPDGAALVGGHSLSSRISHFSVDDTVAPGTVRIVQENGQRVVRYNAADSSKIREVVRPVARNQEMTDSHLANLVETRLRAVQGDIAPMPIALRLGPRAEVAGRGLVNSPEVRVSNATPWRLLDNMPSSHTRALDAIADPSVLGIVVERVDGKYLISRAGHDSVLEASNSASALDAVVRVARTETGGRGVHLHFRGMNSEQARGFAQTAELHTSGPKSVSLHTSVEAEVGGLNVIGEIRNGRWNVAKAEVKVANTVTPNALARRVDFDIAIPHRSTAARISARVSIVFKETVRITADLLTVLRQRIETILRSLVQNAEDLDLLLASRRLMYELRVGDEAVGSVEIRLAGDAGDIQIVQNLQLAQDAVGE